MAVEERVEVARKATDVSVNGDIPRMDGAKGLFAFGVVDAVSIRRRRIKAESLDAFGIHPSSERSFLISGLMVGSETEGALVLNGRYTSLSNFYFNRFSPRPAERRFSRR
jgi:hypothetical protein